MSLKDKFKTVLTKVSRGKSAKKTDGRKDCELGAEEVLKEEVFPEKSKSARKPAAAKRCCRSSSSSVKNAAQKPASKRTRPTNNGYQMIDPSDDTCDAGKS